MTFSVVMAGFSVEGTAVVVAGFAVVSTDDSTLLIGISEVVTGFIVVDVVASVIGFTEVGLGFAISGVVASPDCSSLFTIAGSVDSSVVVSDSAVICASELGLSGLLVVVVAFSVVAGVPSELTAAAGVEDGTLVGVLVSCFCSSEVAWSPAVV